MRPGRHQKDAAKDLNLSRISVFRYDDGYYAVGYEGEPKWFVPTHKDAVRVVNIFLNDLGIKDGWVRFNPDSKNIRTIKKTFRKYIN